MWIESTIDIVSNKDEDLGLKTEPTKARFLFSVKDVVSIWERFKKDVQNEIDPKGTMLTLRDGETYSVDISYDELKKILTDGT